MAVVMASMGTRIRLLSRGMIATAKIPMASDAAMKSGVSLELRNEWPGVRRFQGLAHCWTSCACRPDPVEVRQPVFRQKRPDRTSIRLLVRAEREITELRDPLTVENVDAGQ